MAIANVMDVTVADLLERVAARLPLGYRFVTLTCTDLGETFDILYHFDKDYEIHNFRLHLAKGQALPSIAGIYVAAGLVENELREFFGIDVQGNPLDYGGRLYLSEGAPNAPLRKDGVPAAEPVRREVTWPAKP